MKRDLEWFVNENIISTIDVIVTIPMVNRVNIRIIINADGEVSEFEFVENWEI